MPVPPNPQGLSEAELRDDDALDVEIVALLKDTVLPETAGTSRRGSSRAGVDVAVPPGRLQAIYSLLRHGTARAVKKESAVKDAGDTGNSAAPRVREQLARACIQALVDAPGQREGQDVDEAATLRDDVIGGRTTLGQAATAAIAAESGAAVMGADNSSEPWAPAGSTVAGDNAHPRGDGSSAESLLRSCEAALARFTDSNGASPAEDELSELRFVLLTATSLISPRHRAAAQRLYPQLVACIPALAAAPRDVGEALAEVLQRYAGFIFQGE